MKTIISSLILAASFNAFAVSECTDFGSDAPYGGNITEESAELSYNNCPASVLVNGEFVAPLFMLKEVNGETQCVYSFGKVVFSCKK